MYEYTSDIHLSVGIGENDYVYDTDGLLVWF